MSVTHVAGIDPGLVHTGVVLLTFDKKQRVLEVDHEAVVGPDAVRVKQFFGATRPDIYIEGYRTRSNFGTDTQMVQAVSDFRRALPGSVVLQNTGVKKVVRRPLMELLGVWSFPTVTHHQDLRSAARIALLGMLREDHTNRLLADVVCDHLKGRTWNVAH